MPKRLPQRVASLHRDSLKMLPQWESKPPEGEIERAADWAFALEGRVKVKQGRVGEGEADVRRALFNRLSKSGKFHADTAGMLGVLVYVIQEQGRYAGSRAAAAPSDRYLPGPWLPLGLRS